MQFAPDHIPPYRTAAVHIGLGRTHAACPSEVVLRRSPCLRSSIVESGRRRESEEGFDRCS